MIPCIIKASYEETLIKLANAEIEIEGLKDQLDDALSSEDMVVRLTKRNLMLGKVYFSVPLSRWYSTCGHWSLRI